jgi:hypothetical protein
MVDANLAAAMTALAVVVSVCRATNVVSEVVVYSSYYDCY